jgi:hypothetical protein
MIANQDLLRQARSQKRARQDASDVDMIDAKC